MKTESKKDKHSYTLEIKKILTLLWNSYFISMFFRRKQSKTKNKLKNAGTYSSTLKMLEEKRKEKIEGEYSVNFAV